VTSHLPVGMASTYTWKQDTVSATISVLVPFSTTHSDLKLLMSRRRFTLQQRGLILLQRRLFGAIDPRRTRAYTMHEYSGEFNEVRVTVFKEAISGWSSLFVGDAPRQHLQKKPMGKAEEDEAAKEAAEEARLCSLLSVDDVEEAAPMACATPRMHQTWRTGAGPNTPRVAPSASADGRPVSALGDYEGTRNRRCSLPRQTWRTMPGRSGAQRAEASEEEEVLEEPMALPTGAVPLLERPMHTEPPSEKETIIERPKKPKKEKKPVPAYKGLVDSDYSGSSEEEVHDPGEERDYPLPGSRSSCDGCDTQTNRFYHCVHCGIDDSAFDLCLKCHRKGFYLTNHLRTFPYHELQLVTPKSAPIALPPPKPKPPPPPVTAIQKTPPPIKEPLQANTKYEWTQTSEEVNLIVYLGPAATRRDLKVEIYPMRLRVTIQGHLIISGGFEFPMLNRDSTWTFDSAVGELHIMMPKSECKMISKLFASEERLNPGLALKQVCDDPDPYQGGYMDLSPEARQIVDLHRNHRHAKATGKEEWAAEMEEEMKMMRFQWGSDNKDPDDE